MKTNVFLAAVVLLLVGINEKVAGSYSWRGIRVHKSTVGDVKKALGEPTLEYREQLLYENQVFDPAHVNGQRVKLSTVVLNVAPNGSIESVFLSPEWGTTDQELRSFFGKGRKMTYKKFLATTGEVRIGAGTRPNEKLHYIDLDSPCEVFSESRVLLLYQRRDVVSGDYLVQLILFY
ncbi:MAG: hypothetical protein OEN50_15380 [Deltaproteobacteria bacterium]|nr:hypothetical protein [Deltaproteobacteria bacterium]